MDIGTFRGITTLLVMFCFLGIVAWAYSRHRKQDFDEASRLPFADDDDENLPGQAPAASDDEAHSRHTGSGNDRGDNTP